MVEKLLKDVLVDLDGTDWYWSFKVTYRQPNFSKTTSGRVKTIYTKGNLLVRWDEDVLTANFGDYPPLSFSDREVVEYHDGIVTISNNDWDIYFTI